MRGSLNQREKAMNFATRLAEREIADAADLIEYGIEGCDLGNVAFCPNRAANAVIPFFSKPAVLE